MKKTFIPLALATALFTTGCKDSENIIDTPSTPDLTDHEAISFTMADGQSTSTTRAFYAEGLTRAGFSSSTDILMHIQSDEKTTSGTAGSVFTRTKANAAAEVSSVGYSVVTFTNTSDGTTTENNIRYWDDCYGRKAQLSVFAVAIPNKTISSTSKLKVTDLSAPSSTWGNFTTSDNHNISWSVTTDQSTEGILAGEDLVYSNNIREGGKNGVYRWNGTSYPTNSATGHNDGRMVFTLNDASITDGPGHFDRGHMDFKHSLSRLTVTLVEGSGFDNTSTSTDFKFKSGTQIQLNNMNIRGTLAINTGTWTAATDSPSGNITSMNVITASTSSNAAATYQAQMLPGYVIRESGSSSNIMQFTIDDNTYFITEKMIYDALVKDETGTWYNSNKSNSEKLNDAGYNISAKTITMAQGHNYQLKITVNKTKIEAVTATIAAWDEIVAAEQSIDNAHFTITDIYNNTGTAEANVHLFRITEDLGTIWTSGDYPSGKGEAYQGKYKNDEATMTAHTSANVWSTNWYFNDNQTLYHIRSLNDLACKGKTTSASDKANLDDTDYTSFSMVNGAQTSSDYHWGAPMQADAAGSTSTKFKYDESNGFKAHLHKGLPSMTNTATNPINITELHMMSNINVIIRTPGSVSEGTATYGTNGVELVKNSQQTEVTITRLYNKAKVDMGIGLVTVDNSETTTDKTGLDEIKAGVKAGEKMTKPSATLEQKTDADNKTYVATQAFTYAVVPQHLCRTASGATPADDDYIGITIKTPDNNEYYVVKKLSDIKPTNVGSSKNQTTNDAITRWYPNHSYTYTFTISKKGIEAITCTLADWVNVTGENTNIDLES